MKWTTGIAVATAIGLSVGMAAPSAGADKPSVAAPAAVTVVAPSSHPAVYSCTANGVVFSITAYTPTRASNVVVSKGNYKNTGSLIPCNAIGFWVYAQTKVCGFWGCNYETKNSSGGTLQSANYSISVNQTCRGGTNRYRTYAKFRYMLLEFDQMLGLILVEQSPITHTSSAPEFTC